MMFMLCSLNYLLEEINRHFPNPGLHIDLSNHEPLSDLNGVFMTYRIGGMLEVKYYLYFDDGFPFSAVLIDMYTRFQEVGPLTTAPTLYYEIYYYLLTDQRRKG